MQHLKTNLWIGDKILDASKIKIYYDFKVIFAFNHKIKLATIKANKF